MKKILIFALSFYCLSCSDSDKTFFSSSRRYMHYLSSSEADCLNHEPQINCSQVVDFNTDGSANLVLTDIAHLGKYELKANKIHLSTSNDLGNSDRIIFSIISDQEIKRDDDNTIWVLKK